MSNDQWIERDFKDWTSSDHIRQIAFQLTGNRAFDAQDNLEFLRTYLNSNIVDKNRLFGRATWANGIARFYYKQGRFVYNFRSENTPSDAEFLSAFHRFS